MRKNKKVILDPKMLDGKKISYPCKRCREKCSGNHYRSCNKWRTWFHYKWREVTGKANRGYIW